MERNRIDQLIRNKVGSLHDKAGSSDLREMERLLNRRSRRQRGGWLFFWPLGLLLCAGAVWAVVHISSGPPAPVASVRHDSKPSKAKNPDSSFQSLPTIQEESLPADSHSALSPLTEDQVYPGAGTPQQIEENAIASVPRPASPARIKNEAFEPRISTTVPSQHIVPVGSTKPASELTGSTPASRRHEAIASAQQPAAALHATENTKDENITSDRTSTEPGTIEAPALGDSIPDTLVSDSIKTDAELPFEPEQPVQALANGWHVQGGISYNHVRPVFGSTAGFAPYLDRRSQEEHSTWRWGYDVQVRKDFGRSQLGTGIGLLEAGEDVQYKPTEQTQETYVDSSYWDWITTEITFIYDSVETDTGWIYLDSTYIETDTVYVEDFDTLYTTTRDDRLTLHNGFTRISMITIPLVYGYQLLDSDHWGLMPRAGIELAYVTGRRGYYLATSQQELIPVGTWSSYRNVLVNGVASVELRRRLWPNSYIAFEPGIRYSITSLNKDFAHRYFTYYGRLAIGVRF